MTLLVATVQSIAPLTVRVKPSTTIESASPVWSSGYTPTTTGIDVLVDRRADTGAVKIMGPA